MEKKLDVIPAELDDAALAAFAPVMRHDTSGGLASLEARFRNAQLFAVIDAGVIVCRYALRVDQHDNGAEGVIVAAAGALRGVDLTHTMLPAIEAQFSGVRAISVLTARRGLVEKMRAHGYRVEAYKLRKRLEH